jgi:hypothetical protein
MVFKGLGLGSLGEIYTIYNEMLLDPEENNTIIGLK